jgi:hypothetical protein
VQSGTEYIPTFNMALIFRVPRVHRVTPVIVDKSRSATWSLTVVCHSMCTTLSHCDALRPPSGLDCNVPAADTSAMQMGVRQSTN